MAGQLHEMHCSTDSQGRDQVALKPAAMLEERVHLQMHLQGVKPWLAPQDESTEFTIGYMFVPAATDLL